jgi:hypothetical protein
MPLTPPYALAQVSVNGGAAVSGGTDVPSAATLQFSGVSTVGWNQQRWEFYEYPEGFATPAGWALAADGTIFSTDVLPSLVTLPANTVLWGPWSLRLKVNEAVSNNASAIPNLTDVGTICNMLSPKGQRMIAALEGTQFCTPTTQAKAWVRTHQRNQRTIETLLGGGASVAVPALTIDWSLSGVYTKALAAGANAFTFANATDGQTIVVALTGAASTVTWPTVKWAGGVAPTQTASGTDVYTFLKIGATIYGSAVQAMA